MVHVVKKKQKNVVYLYVESINVHGLIGKEEEYTEKGLKTVRELLRGVPSDITKEEFNIIKETLRNFKKKKYQEGIKNETKHKRTKR